MSSCSYEELNTLVLASTPYLLLPLAQLKRPYFNPLTSLISNSIEIFLSLIMEELSSETSWMKFSYKGLFEQVLQSEGRNYWMPPSINLLIKELKDSLYWCFFRLQLRSSFFEYYFSNYCIIKAYRNSWTSSKLLSSCLKRHLEP